MTAQAGKDLLLKLGDGGAPQAFTSVAGLRAKTLSLASRPIESTHAESPGRWRELLDGAAVRSASIEGSGVFVDAESDAQVRAVFFDQVIRDWMIIVPDFGEIIGRFIVSRLEYSGRHDGEASYTIALESAGALSFEPI